MGVTSYDTPILLDIIKWHNPKSVTELGAQNNYAQPNLPAPYMREWYEQRGIRYDSIDLNGECGAYQIDLSKTIQEVEKGFYLVPTDLVTDFGTSEHVGDNGKFSWEAIYNCWLIKHKFLKVGEVMISENPLTGNWPGHGFNYYTPAFYVNLLQYAGYREILLTTHAAMNNTTDGWNVVSVMKKTSETFPTFEEFKTLDLRQS